MCHLARPKHISIVAIHCRPTFACFISILVLGILTRSSPRNPLSDPLKAIFDPMSPTVIPDIRLMCAIFGEKNCEKCQEAFNIWQDASSITFSRRIHDKNLLNTKETLAHRVGVGGLSRFSVARGNCAVHDSCRLWSTAQWRWSS